MRHGESTRIRKHDTDYLEYIDLRKQIKEKCEEVRRLRIRIAELESKLFGGNGWIS